MTAQRSTAHPLVSNSARRILDIPEYTMFTVNEGTADRVFRGVLGLGLISLAFVGPQTPWGWFGLAPLATALIGWCPAYTLLGINTCGIKTAK